MSETPQEQEHPNTTKRPKPWEHVWLIDPEMQTVPRCICGARADAENYAVCPESTEGKRLRQRGRRDQLAEDRAWMTHKADCTSLQPFAEIPREYVAGLRPCSCGLSAHLSGGESK